MLNVSVLWNNFCTLRTHTLMGFYQEIISTFILYWVPLLYILGRFCILGAKIGAKKCHFPLAKIWWDFTKKSYQHSSYTGCLYCTQWCSTLYSTPWATLDSLGLPWASLGYFGLPRASLGYLELHGASFGVPWASLGSLGQPWVTLGFLNTYTGCPINIVPSTWTPILGLIIATAPSSALKLSKVCTLCDFGLLQFDTLVILQYRRIWSLDPR
jgi:hypothetical protein